MPECNGIFTLIKRHRISENTACSDNFIPIYIESAPYVSASQLAATPISFSIASTPQTGVPNAVKKSGQHLEDSAPILFHLHTPYMPCTVSQILSIIVRSLVKTNSTLSHFIEIFTALIIGIALCHINKLSHLN